MFLRLFFFLLDFSVFYLNMFYLYACKCLCLYLVCIHERFFNVTIFIWMICVLSFQVNEAKKRRNRFSLDLLDVIWCLVSALNHEFVYVLRRCTKTKVTIAEKKKIGELCVFFLSQVGVFLRGGNKQICSNVEPCWKSTTLKWPICDHGKWTKTKYWGVLPFFPVHSIHKPCSNSNLFFPALIDTRRT